MKCSCHTFAYDVCKSMTVSKRVSCVCLTHTAPYCFINYASHHFAPVLLKDTDSNDSAYRFNDERHDVLGEHDKVP